MLSLLKIGFALAKKGGGIGGGRQAYSRHAVYMADALALCRTALVSTAWTIFHLVGTNGSLLSRCRGTISDVFAVFSEAECLLL